MCAETIKKSLNIAVNSIPIEDRIYSYESIKLDENSPNVKKILLHKADAVIESIKNVQNTYSVKGQSHITIIYQAESGKAESVNTFIPFEFITQGESDNDRLVVDTEILSADFAISKQRRIDVTLNIMLKGFYTSLKDYSYIENMSDGSDIICKTARKTAGYLSALTLTEPVEFIIPNIKLDEAKVVFSNVVLQDTMTNSTPTSIMLSATLCSQSLIEGSADGEANYRVITDSTTVTKTASLSEDNTYKSYCVSTQTRLLDAQAVYEEDSMCLRILAEAIFVITFINELCWNEIDDLYSLSAKLTAETQNAQTTTFDLMSKTELSLKETKSLDPKAVFYKPCLSGMSTTHQFGISDNILSINGEVKISCFILESTDGNYECVEFALPFYLQEEITLTDAQNMYINCEAYCENLYCDDGKLYFEGSVAINVLLAQNRDERCITNIIREEIDKQEKDYFDITVVYYVDGDDLWNIAKENQTTIATILADNMVENVEEIKTGTPIVVKKQ